jgi:hypothetical protein
VTAVDVGDLLIVGGGLAFVLRWPSARNRRALLTLGALASVYVIAAIVLSGVPEGAVKIAVVWSYVVIILRFPTLLGMLSAADAKIDRSLRTIFWSVNNALDGWRLDPGPPSWAQTAEACESALSRLESLPPVGRRWQATVEFIRRYISAVRDAATAFDPHGPTPLPPEVTGPALASLVRQIDDAWQGALRIRDAPECTSDIP